MTRNSNHSGLGLLRQPSTLVFGPGRRTYIPVAVREHGTRALICTDERMAASAEFAEIVREVRAEGVDVDVYSATQPDLPVDNIRSVVWEFTDAGIDVVVGIGGGSCLDMAKVTGMLLGNGGDVADYYGEFRVAKRGVPVVTVPTTGGTGAEISCISVVFDTDRQVKVGVASPFLEAQTAIVDPELTLTCPPGLTAATAADALSHLIESFVDVAKNPTASDMREQLYVGKNVLADLYCREGLQLLNRSIPKLLGNLDDVEVRSDTMLAATFAGFALNTAGTAGAHAIQSPIGALTHTAHGFGVGALLPFVMRYNLPARVEEFAEIGRLFGVASSHAPALEQAKQGIRRVDELLALLDVPNDLNELGLVPEQFEEVAEQALLSTRLIANNPRPLPKSAMLEILERGYANDRDFWATDQ